MAIDLFHIHIKEGRPTPAVYPLLARSVHVDIRTLGEGRKPTPAVYQPRAVQHSVPIGVLVSMRIFEARVNGGSKCSSLKVNLDY